MTLSGTAEKIIFRNAENGYTVLTVNIKGKEITAVGCFPMLTEGEEVTLTGEYSQNSRYGDQFQVKEVQVEKPKTGGAIEKYLASGLFFGIGPVTAARIVREFGTKTLDIIENNPSLLTKVPGITAKKALSISDAVLKLKEMQEAVLYLQTLGVSVNMAVKIWKVYENTAKKTIDENPYKLIEDIDGIGFTTADAIAQKLGIEKHSRFRISAGIIYSLKEVVGKNGHTYLPKEELVALTVKLLDLDDGDLVPAALSELEVTGQLMSLEKDNAEIYMLTKHYLTEKAIASRLVALVSNAKTIETNVTEDVAGYERTNGITLHEGQRNAVSESVKNGVNVITGGPGTGKTTIIKCVLSIFRNHGITVQLCAPTGRAAKRMSEACGEDAKTIHRLLDLDFKDGRGHFTYNENDKLDADVIVIDEVSMCDEYVFCALIKAIKKGGRLIIVGDKDQLPSVGAGNVLGDIIASKAVPVSYLTEIYRQGAESLIIKNAHRINRGEMPLLDNSSKDFFYSQKTEPREVLETAVEMVTSRLPKFTGLSGKEIQVLCPMKKGAAGVEAMNVALQDALNPYSGGKSEMKWANGVLRTGDKVIHTQNNYQLAWTKENGEAGVGVFNGDIGFIEKIDKGALTVAVRFEDGKLAAYSSGDLDQLRLAYAISIHKSQGSEFDVVLIAIVSGNYMILTRNLLYTAVTRAKKTVVLVGDKKNVAMTVRNNYTAKRYSLLSDFIKEEAGRAFR